MEQLIKYSVGIDISKDTFHTSILAMSGDGELKVKASHSFDNKPNGFKEFHQWVKKHSKREAPTSFTMEATGVYYESLAWHLYGLGCDVAVVLPTKAKNYMRSIGYKTKNDKIDAKGLAQYGGQQKLRLWKPLSPGIAKLRCLTRQHESLVKLRTSALSQVHSYEHSVYEVKEVVRQLKKMVKFYEQELQIIIRAIEQIVNEDALLKERFENICLIKGLSLLSLATIIAETNGFELMNNKRQLTSYAGYDIIENQSGNHVGRTKISKKGNYRIRRILHMPSLVAVKHENLFDKLYKRVYDKSGVKMKGYVAVQRKMLQLVYFLWKNNEAYKANPQNTSGNDEPKPFFPLDSKHLKKKVAQDVLGLH